MEQGPAIMKLCRFRVKNFHNSTSRLGARIEDTDHVLDLNLALAVEYSRMGFRNFQERADYILPTSLSRVLRLHEKPMDILQEAYGTYLFHQKIGLDYKKFNVKAVYSLSEIKLECPLDEIPMYRDFYVHEKHVKKGFEKRAEPVPEAWYEFPVYYKGSTQSFIGNEDIVPWPSYTDKLDYELELGIVIGKDGKNIRPENALEHVFGLTVLNDISARDIQRKEMSVRLGPSKGKDFCTILGPFVVTMDEFNHKEPALTMEAFINGEKWSSGNSSDGHFSIAQMIEFSSKEEWLRAGDLFGSGTVGTGCGLELDRWIKDGDSIELKIQGIGSLKNIIGKKNRGWN
jgi:2-keto-4-pentenoate hydratase/2-oxohepta-3-ene-1,7-dioic acid hydratase in catechol pathway